MVLTALSGMSVVMDCEAAWAIEPFPTAATDMLARFISVTVFRVYWAGFFQWRRAVPGIWPP